jgi:hypothetical protein
MNQHAQNKKTGRRFTPLGIVFAILGLLLFSYFVKSAGLREILDGITRLGAGFLLVLAISGLRPIVRSLAWTRCFEEPYHLRFRDALWAYLIGDAVGTLVPLGIFVSEPAKAAMVRRKGVPLIAGLSALAIENLFYSLSVALFIFAGMIALLFSFQLNKPLRIISTGTLAGVVVLIALAFLIIRKQWKFLSGALEYLYGRGIGRSLLETRRERVRSLEDRVYGFYGRNSSRFLPIMLLEACFHLSGVAEIYVVLYFISDTFTGGTSSLLLTAFVLESVNRVINVVFKFVPLRLGVDEAGSGWITHVLNFGKASGVTLAIIRKARIICWTALGVALLVRRGLSLSDVEEETQAAVAREIKAGTVIPASESR